MGLFSAANTLPLDQLLLRVELLLGGGSLCCMLFLENICHTIKLCCVSFMKCKKSNAIHHSHDITLS